MSRGNLNNQQLYTLLHAGPMLDNLSVDENAKLRLLDHAYMKLDNQKRDLRKLMDGMALIPSSRPRGFMDTVKGWFR